MGHSVVRMWAMIPHASHMLILWHFAMESVADSYIGKQRSSLILAD